MAKSNTDIDFEEKPDGAEGRKYKPTPENYVIIRLEDSLSDIRKLFLNNML